jgi:hypothetical protein
MEAEGYVGCDVHVVSAVGDIAGGVARNVMYMGCYGCGGR